ncbi:MAG: hypothetical protein WC152_03015, partial [Candidatus Izemoplasmatales bacterium]
MKKILLITLSLFLIIPLMGCPSIRNLQPNFKRIIEVNGEEELISLRALDTDIYESDKKAFIDEENKKLAADANYVVQEFDPFKYYDSKY